MSLVKEIRRLIAEALGDAAVQGEQQVQWGKWSGTVPPGVNVGDRVPALDNSVMYRIFELKNGQYHSLFHGTTGSRALPVGQWIDADIKPVKNPGTSVGVFLSGFHVVRSLEDARNYLKKFKNKASQNYRLMAVQVGEVRRKPHATSEVMLTDKIKLLKEVQ
jgi:hypothetical protein